MLKSLTSSAANGIANVNGNDQQGEG